MSLAFIFDLILSVLLLVSLPCFFVCLRNYLHARKSWKDVPCEETRSQKETHKHKLLVISVILLVLLLISAVMAATSSNSVVFA